LIIDRSKLSLLSMRDSIIAFSTMLIEFDQNTLANMTAALEFVCKRIPADRDTPAIRKQIADGLVACAKSGHRRYPDFQDAGTRIVAEILRSKRSKWLSWLGR